MNTSTLNPKRKSLKRLGNFVYNLVRLIIVCGITYYILYPILEKLLGSFMTIENLYDKSVGIIPRDWTLENIKIVIKETHYWSSLLNTIYLSAVAALTQAISCTLVGYGFARFKFPFKNLLFGAVIIVLVVPVDTIIIPMYLNYSYFDIFGIFKLINGEGINLNNSVWPFLINGLTCMGLKNGLYIYLMRQFYRGTPKELEEAAKIDGAGYAKTFFSVMLPLSRPILFVVGILSFVWQWTDSFYASWFYGGGGVLGVEMDGLTENIAVLRALVGMDNADDRLAMMLRGIATLLIAFPLIILYAFTHKNLVGGIERSGIVG